MNKVDIEKKMDELLLSLTDREREVLAEKLDGKGNA
jgi:DNA-binding CsgD family transcriptional regulator